MNTEDLFISLIALAIGCLILFKTKFFIQSAINSDDKFCDRVGIPQASENTRRLLAQIIAKILGWGLIIFFGVLQLFAGFGEYKIFRNLQ